jgi:DNA-binding NarL/FixJ family response regulator
MPLSDVRVLIVGDSPLARAGLAALLSPQPGLSIVGQTSTDTDLLTALTAYTPDALTWDMGWETQRGLEQLADVQTDAPPILVLLSNAGRAADALNAGARGVLLQETDSDVLASALKAVAMGLIVVAPELADAMVAAPGDDNTALPEEALTPRELEVLSLLAEGLPNKTVASRLGISEHTVKFHVNAVMSKLGAQSRTEAVVRATRMGLIVL